MEGGAVRVTKRREKNKSSINIYRTKTDEDKNRTLRRVCVCVSILFNRANYSLTSMLLSACGYQCAAFVCVPNQTPRWFFPFKSGLRGRFSRRRGVSGRTGDRSAAAARGGGRGGRRRKKKENFSTKSRENATDTCCERGVWVNESVCVLCFHIYMYISVCVAWRANRERASCKNGSRSRSPQNKKRKKKAIFTSGLF